VYLLFKKKIILRASCSNIIIITTVYHLSDQTCFLAILLKLDTGYGIILQVLSVFRRCCTYIPLASYPAFTVSVKFYNFIYYLHVFFSRVHPFWRFSAKPSALPREFYFRRFIYIIIMAQCLRDRICTAAPRNSYNIPQNDFVGIGKRSDEICFDSLSSLL